MDNSSVAMRCADSFGVIAPVRELREEGEWLAEERVVDFGELIDIVSFCPHQHAASLIAVITTHKIVFYDLECNENPNQAGKVAYQIVRRRTIKRPGIVSSIVDIAWDSATMSVGLPGKSASAVLYFALKETLVKLEVIFDTGEASTKVISDHHGFSARSVAVSYTSDTTLASAASDSVCRIWSRTGRDGKKFKLSTRVDMGNSGRFLRFHPLFKGMLMFVTSKGKVLFFDVRYEICVDEVDMTVGREPLVALSADWHPTLPTCFLVCADIGVLFHGAEQRKLEDPAAEALWCPGCPRYLAMITLARDEVQVYDGSRIVKRLKAPGSFTSISWHSFLPILATTVGRVVSFYSFEM